MSATIASTSRPTWGRVPPAPPQPPAQASAAAWRAPVTWAETAECTCPEACERDHEHD